MDLFAIDKLQSSAVRRLVAFFSLVLLVLSVVALGNQSEFKAGGSRSGFRNQRDPANERGGVPIVPPEVQAPPESKQPSELAGIQVLSGGRPQKAQAPKPGRYRYRFTLRENEGQQSEQTLEVVMSVTAVSASASETRLVYTIIAAGASPLKYEVVWNSSEMLHLRWYSDGDSEFNCDWEPDLLQLKLPFERSSQWNLRTSCDGTAGGRPQKIENEEGVKVTDAVRTRVGSTAIDGWRLERNSKLTSTGDGDPETQIHTKVEVFSPVHGLIVKSIARVTGTSPGGSPTEREEITELLSLDPS